MAHPTLGNRPVPASPYPRESQSFASHANTHRARYSTASHCLSVSLPRFSPRRVLFFFSHPFRLSPPLPPCPPLRLVREFSWLAELTAFGKIASSTHRSRGLSERPCSHKEMYPPRLLRVSRRPSLSLSCQRHALSSPISVHTAALRAASRARGRWALGRGSFRRVCVVRCAWRPDSLTCVNAGLRRVFRSSSQFRVHT